MFHDLTRTEAIFMGVALSVPGALLLFLLTSLLSTLRLNSFI